MKKILVVDDNEQSLYMLKVLLEGNGYDFAMAGNGREALEAARSSTPNLIISDILMPEMDGFALCRQIKTDDQLKKTPFIFYTATYTDPKDEKFGLSLGAVRFIKKPTAPDKFIEIVKNVLEEYESGRIIETKTPISDEKIFYKKYNAALVHKLETKLLELKQMNQRLSTLYQASFDMANLNSCAEVISYGLKNIMDMLGCSHALFYEFDEHKNEFLIQMAEGYSEKQLAELRSKLVFSMGEERGLVGWVGKTQEPLIINQTSEDHRWIKIDNLTKSALFLPVICKTNKIGVISILSTKTANFSDGDLRDMSTLGNYMSVVIEKARLFEATKQSENRFRNIFESSIDAIVMFDIDKLITDWSKGAENIFGYKKDKILGKNIDILFPSQTRQQMAEAINEARVKGCLDILESQHITKTGHLVDVEMTITFLESDRTFTSILRDITDRKRAVQAEAELANSAIRDRILIEQSRDGIVILDQTGAVHEANQKFAEMLGYSQKEITKLHIWDWDFKIPKEEIMEMIRDIDEAGDTFETQHKRKDGTIFDVGISTNASIFSGQKLIFCVCRDITERKQRAEALRESKERFSTAFNSAPIGMSLDSLDGNYLQVNHAFCEIVGYSEKELLQKTFQEITYPDDLEIELEYDHQMLAGERSTYQIEKRYIHKRGDIVWTSLSVSLVTDKEGSPQYFLCQIQDITKRKRAHQLLNALNVAAGEMGKALTQEEVFKAISGELKQLGFLVSLFLLDETREKLFTKYVSFESAVINTTEDLLRLKHENFSIPVDAVDLYRQVVREKETVFAENSNQMMEQLFPKIGKKPINLLLKTLHVKNGITAPLIVQDQVIGVFSIHSDNITRDDVSATTAFANQLAGAWNKTRLLQDLKETVEGTVLLSAAMVEARDPYTAGHQERVAGLAAAIAVEMGLSQDNIDGVRMAGKLHDLGKINVPAEILSKPGKISELEYELIKTHPRIGFDLLKKIKFPWPIAEIVLQHHEKINGSGYPQGLKGNEIMLNARILSVADTVEAMASHRPYRPALGIEAALEQIQKDRGTVYDPDVVDACLKIMHEGYEFPLA